VGKQEGGGQGSNPDSAGQKGSGQGRPAGSSMVIVKKTVTSSPPSQTPGPPNCIQDWLLLGLAGVLAD
jgi:hypothetical protein